MWEHVGWGAAKAGGGDLLIIKGAAFVIEMMIGLYRSPT